MITTFKIFKHNFWTRNRDCHRLYEGSYFPLTPKEILVGTGFLRRLNIVRIQPPAWPSTGMYMNILQFSDPIRKMARDWQKKNSKNLGALRKKLQEAIAYEFCERMNLTREQARALMRLQRKELSVKELRVEHRKIGLGF